MATLNQQPLSQARPPSRLRPVLIALSLLALVSATLLAGVPTARALPPAGTDNLAVSGQVSVSSRIGQESIPLTGTLTIQRGAPQLLGGVEVEDAQIVAMNLSGTSLTGPVTVAQSPTLTSTGQLRSLLPPPNQFPASSFFDVFVQITAPASPSPTITLHNATALHVAPTPGGTVNSWPPLGVTYGATPNPCVPLLPSLPKNICVTSLSFTVLQPVGGLARAPEVAAPPLEAAGSSARSAGLVAGIALGVAAGVVLASGLAWHLRRALFDRR